MTGFTLPGMIDEPGWVAGSAISPMAVRGPDPSQRMSLAILKSAVATVVSAPEANTVASLAAFASKWSSASRKA